MDRMRQFLVIKNPTLNGEKIEFPRRPYREWTTDTEYVKGDQVTLSDGLHFFVCISDHTSTPKDLCFRGISAVGIQTTHWLKVPMGNVSQLSYLEYDSKEKLVTMHIDVDESTQMLFVPRACMGLDLYEKGLPKIGTKRPKITISAAVVKGIWAHISGTGYRSDLGVPHRKVTLEVKGNVVFTEE